MTIQSRAATPAYRAGWERVFGKLDVTEPGAHINDEWRERLKARQREVLDEMRANLTDYKHTA